MLPQFDYAVITILTITIIIVVMIIKNFLGDGEQLNISGTVRLRGQVRGGIQGGDCLRWVAQLPTVSQFSQVRVVGQGSKNFFSVYSICTSSVQLFRALLGHT